MGILRNLESHVNRNLRTYTLATALGAVTGLTGLLNSPAQEVKPAYPLPAVQAQATEEQAEELKPIKLQYSSEEIKATLGKNYTGMTEEQRKLFDYRLGAMKASESRLVHQVYQNPKVFAKYFSELEQVIKGLKPEVISEYKNIYPWINPNQGFKDDNIATSEELLIAAHEYSVQNFKDFQKVFGLTLKQNTSENEAEKAWNSIEESQRRMIYQTYLAPELAIRPDEQADYAKFLDKNKDNKEFQEKLPWTFNPSDKNDPMNKAFFRVHESLKGMIIPLGF